MCFSLVVCTFIWLRYLSTMCVSSLQTRCFLSVVAKSSPPTAKKKLKQKNSEKNFPIRCNLSFSPPLFYGTHDNSSCVVISLFVTLSNIIKLSDNVENGWKCL